MLVLVEGASDVAALAAFMAARGVSSARVELVNLHGVTNIRTALVAAHGRTPAPVVLGLYDAAEEHVVRRGLIAVGVDVDQGALPLEGAGFFVCSADLEEELIRALGPDGVTEVIEALGLGGKLATLQQQSAWRERPFAEQVHRFCGVASGRKIMIAGQMAEAVPASRVPRPIRLLLDRIEVELGELSE